MVAVRGLSSCSAGTWQKHNSGRPPLLHGRGTGRECGPLAHHRLRTRLCEQKNCQSVCHVTMRSLKRRWCATIQAPETSPNAALLPGVKKKQALSRHSLFERPIGRLQSHAKRPPGWAVSMEPSVVRRRSIAKARASSLKVFTGATRPSASISASRL